MEHYLVCFGTNINFVAHPGDLRFLSCPRSDGIRFETWGPLVRQLSMSVGKARAWDSDMAPGNNIVAC